jgi:hypothetical protein
VARLLGLPLVKVGLKRGLVVLNRALNAWRSHSDEIRLIVFKHAGFLASALKTFGPLWDDFGPPRWGDRAENIRYCAEEIAENPKLPVGKKLLDPLDRLGVK